MEHKINEELDLKSILIQLAIGFAAGVGLLLVCGLGELVHDLICK